MTERSTAGGAPALRPTCARVDLDAIAHNIRLVRERVAPADVMAVVKADAYGHGAVPVARAALRAGASWLAVALVEEGEELRAAGITAPILLLSEPTVGSAARLAAADLTPTIYTLELAESLRVQAARRGRPLQVHIKADTGMGRVGIPRPQWDRFLRNLRAWPELKVQAFWTHLACADEPGHPSIERQVRRFDEFLQLARTHGFDPVLSHIANSAASLTLDQSGHDAVRLGIAMYGCAPSEQLADAADLRPAMRLVTEVAFVKRIPEGTSVSYGHTWTSPSEGRLATLPVGYADGMPRNLSNRIEVLIGGRRYPVVGSICMDQILVWCGDDEIEPGDEVVLIGRQGDDEVTALEWARTLGTITYEVVTGIGGRVPRVHEG